MNSNKNIIQMPQESTQDVATEGKYVTKEQVSKLFEENKDILDLVGGLDLFETIMETPDDLFETLKPQFVQIFEEVIDERQTTVEILAIMSEMDDKDFEKIQSDYETVIDAIEQIEELSQVKKDFLKEILSITTNKINSLFDKKNEVVRIPCELEDGVLPPLYAHEGDAGMDIYSPKEYTINPGETIIIPTGIKCAIPKGYALLIQPRSGQSVKTKLRVANTPGLIDSGYRDTIGVIVENIEPPIKDIDYEFDENGEIHISSILHGQSYTISAGQRFAQMRLVKVPEAQFYSVDSISEIGEDRMGGFGHSGDF